MENQFFRTISIMDGVTAIAGLGGEYAYLVEGAESALLIDGLAGVGSLKAFVREYTKLPVTLALTHGHLDHSGAAYEYGECYIHPRDAAMLHPGTKNKPGMRRFGDARLDYVVNGRVLKGNAGDISADDVVNNRPVRVYPVFEGDLFDLGGGVLIEAAELPGHTAGSLVFIDRSRHVAYIGDACSRNTVLGTCTVREYKQSLEAFYGRHGNDFDACFGGHSTDAMPKSIFPQAVALCEKIMSGLDDHIAVEHRGRARVLALARGKNMNPANGSLCNIVYSDDKVHGFSSKRTILPL